MAVTTVYTYPLNGTVKDFGIPFEYLARRFVTVTLIGTNRKELTLTTDYRFTSKTNIQTTKAWGPADAYEFIEIRRNTSATDRLVDFADGSILRAYELNIAQIQTMHIAEEARNMVTDTIGVNNAGMLDARARKIVNLADATEPGDAVTLRQEQTWAESTLNSRNAAKTSETNSKASATAAKTSETNSKASETAAKTSETNALSYRNAANTSASNAKTSETNSKASETAAKTSETNSKASENAAKTSETNAAGWAAGVNMPSAVGQGGKMLRQKLDSSGFEYVLPFTTYGLGAQAAQAIPDYAAHRPSGFYRAEGTQTANAPYSVNNLGAVLVIGVRGDMTTYLVKQYAGDLFVTDFAGTPGALAPWERVYTTKNMLDIGKTDSTARAALNLSTAAQYAATVSKTDVTVGRLPKNGDKQVCFATLCANSAGSVRDSLNIASVTKLAVGEYRVSFLTEPDNTAYSVIPSAMTSGNAVGIYLYSEKTTASFRLRVVALSTGALTDPTEFSLVVYR